MEGFGGLAGFVHAGGVICGGMERTLVFRPHQGCQMWIKPLCAEKRPRGGCDLWIKPLCAEKCATMDGDFEIEKGIRCT